MAEVSERARAFPSYQLLQRVKSEPITPELADEVGREVIAASNWYHEVLDNKKLRVNEGLGYATLRSVWASDASKILYARALEDAPGQESFKLHGEAEVLNANAERKPKNNPTGIRAPKCPRCKRGEGSG